MISKDKGDRAMGKAIAYFLNHDYEVCLPIGDKRDYDIITEKDGILARIQVKYAGLYDDKNKCQASLRVMGGNQSFHSVKKYADDAFDFLFIYSQRRRVSDTLE